MKIIVGLGNPGFQYEITRHNVGFMTADLLAKLLDGQFSREGFLGVYADCRYQGEKVLVLKPHTYMNESGQSVRAAVDFYKVDWQDVLVILDDMDLLPGQVRVRAKGSSGGHRGMGSILQHSDSDKIPRVKIGIGHPLVGSVVDFVLKPFAKEELAVVAKTVERAADAALTWVEKGVTETMNHYNGLPGIGEVALAQEEALRQAKLAKKMKKKDVYKRQPLFT